MNMERAAMRGRLAEAEQKRQRLELLIEGYCTSIRAGLNTALAPPADLEIPQLGATWEALENAWGELQVAIGEIERLRRGLAD
ncbi:hypothetical protein [Desulfobulbus elongatus]|uniref:hypothetical protein n=1 Tax=Desulfobulbus elongatus TaxID=53332 RepID=UPI000481B4D6|nr:hypothetical protein [Desulfobulbus elongatus]